MELIIPKGEKMKRLTKQNEYGDYIGVDLLDDETLCRSLSFDETNQMADIFNKLGQYEDIEEDMSFSMPALLRLLIFGCFIKPIGENGEQLDCIYKAKVECRYEEVIGGVIYAVIASCQKGYRQIYMDDNGKTWAFDKRLLETKKEV